MDLTEDQIDKFFLYLKELKTWNKKINLTAITEDKDIITKHFVDSITIYGYLGPGSSIIDVGTGAGFPGIPLAIIDGSLQIDLLDSKEKKVHFVRHVIRKLGLKNVRAFTGRVEDISNGIKRGVYDVVVARAFGDIAKIANNTAGYLNRQGRILLMRGDSGKREWENVEKELEPGLCKEDIAELHIPFSNIRRYLIVLKKDNKEEGESYLSPSSL